MWMVKKHRKKLKEDEIAQFWKKKNVQKKQN